MALLLVLYHFGISNKDVIGEQGVKNNYEY